MEKRKKKKAGRIISWLLAACLAAGIALLPKIVEENRQEETSGPSILSTQAETGDIDEQIIGGGQLSSDSSCEVSIPENILLEKYYVADGDLVEEGDPIAKVDAVSVMTAITDVQATLDELADKIEDAADSSDTETIISAVSGRVKKIYAQTGDRAENVMLNYGALAVISLDDTMAVCVSSDAKISVSDKVTVEFSDGTQVTGKVKSNINSEIIAVIEDDSYEIGAAVTVYDTEGNKLGASELYVYNAWNVKAYDGTVTAVNITEQKKITEDQSLFTLEDVGVSAEYQQLIDTRQKYEQLMHELFIIYSEGVIKAPCSGIVSGTDDDGAYMLLSAGDDGGAVFELLGDIQVTPVIVNQSLPDGVVGQSYSATLVASGDTPVAEGRWSADTLPAGLTLDPSGLISGIPTAAGVTDINVSFTYGEGEIITKELSITVNQTQGQVLTGYLAQVLETDVNAIRVNKGTSPYTITDINNLPAVEPDTREFKEEKTYNGAVIAETDFEVDDIIWLIFDENNELVKAEKVKTTGEDDTPGGDTHNDDTPGGNTNGGTGTGGFSGGSAGGTMPGTSQEEELYSLDELSIATVTSQDHMSITISVDELEITKLYAGQKAMLTMNSLPGETAEAYVKQISNSGENSGGNTKFTVELELEKSSSMLPGMNATVYITLDTRESVVTVPASAVYEENGEYFVYTSYDEETGTLSGRKTVVTGSADANRVEIVSGLADGESVFYEYYEYEEPSMIM